MNRIGGGEYGIAIGRLWSRGVLKLNNLNCALPFRSTTFHVLDVRHMMRMVYLVVLVLVPVTDPIQCYTVLHTVQECIRMGGLSKSA